MSLGYTAFEKQRTLAKRLSRLAGAVIKSHFSRTFTVRRKNISRNSLVTEVDLKSEQLIIDGIHEAFPRDAILSEEAGLIATLPQLFNHVVEQIRFD